jgi:hypothetical protein
MQMDYDFRRRLSTLGPVVKKNIDPSAKERGELESAAYPPIFEQLQEPRNAG